MSGPRPCAILFLRNMMACTVTGQAAGVRDTPAAAVQAELRRQGVRID